MNNKIILSLGIPLEIKNQHGKTATIELNNNGYVVCRFHPNDSVYLVDAKLAKWYPANFFLNLLYNLKKMINQFFD